MGANVDGGGCCTGSRAVSGFAFLGLEDAPAREEIKLIIVATRSKVLAISTLRYAADLLGVAADARKKGHATVPVEKITLVLIRPFDGIVVDEPLLVANQQLFRRDGRNGIADRWAAHSDRAEAEARDGRGLITVESRFAVERAPEGDAAVCATDGEDSTATFD